MTFSIMTFSIMTLSIMTFSIMTINNKGLFVTLSINGTEHNNALPFSECRVLYYFYAECLYAKCRYSEFH
jgi:hypothetical protein